MNTLNTQQVDLFPSVTNPLLDQLVMALDGRVKDSVLLASLFEEQLRNFAGRADFDGQMGMVFGEGNDYGGLRDDFMAGNFGSFPLVEVRSGAELQGANAVYVTETNTIIFSEDFLRRYGDNLPVVNSVLLEEFGHSIDAKVNVSDTPGDEGYIFSSLVQGIELNPTELQTLKRENDLVIINFSDKTSSYNSILLNLENSSFQVEKSSANGYNPGNWETVFNALIASRGTTKVVFINGMNVTDINAANAVKDAFSISKSEQAQFDSLSFKNYENISESDGKEAGNDFTSFNNIIVSELFQYAVNKFDEKYGHLINDYEDWWWHQWQEEPDYYAYGLTKERFELLYHGGVGPFYDGGYKKAKDIIQDPTGVGGNPKIFFLFDDQRVSLTEFLRESGDLEKFGKRVGANPQSDFVEALVQFLYEKPQDVSQNIITGYVETNTATSIIRNHNWEATKELKNSISGNNNSLIFVAHSQGNFFVEDGLNASDFSSVDNRVRIISLGSPTDYSSVKFLEKEKIALFPNGSNDPNSKDPISHLRYNVNDYSSDDYAGKLLHAFRALNAGDLLWDLKYHDLTTDRLIDGHAYLDRQDVKAQFGKFFLRS